MMTLSMDDCRIIQENQTTQAEVAIEINSILNDAFPDENPLYLDVAQERILNCFENASPISTTSLVSSSESDVSSPRSTIVDDQTNVTDDMLLDQCAVEDYFKVLDASEFEEFGPVSACKAPPARRPSEPGLRQRWSENEDELLRQSIKIHGPRNWKHVAKMIPGRDHVQCFQRWSKVLRPGLVKGKWTAQEDAKLIKVISQVEDISNISWLAVSKSVHGRSAKQCRERWRLNLNPSINHEPFTGEEDKKLIALHQRFGNKWTVIKAYFKGRTENSVKTRYHTLQRQDAGHWSPEEDAILMQQYGAHNGDWRQIYSYFKYKRSLIAVKGRYSFLTAYCQWSPNLVRNNQSDTADGSVTPDALLESPDTVTVDVFQTKWDTLTCSPSSRRTAATQMMNKPPTGFFHQQMDSSVHHDPDDVNENNYTISSLNQSMVW